MNAAIYFFYGAGLTLGAFASITGNMATAVQGLGFIVIGAAAHVAGAGRNVGRKAHGD